MDKLIEKISKLDKDTLIILCYMLLREFQHWNADKLIDELLKTK